MDSFVRFSSPTKRETAEARHLSCILILHMNIPSIRTLALALFLGVAGASAAQAEASLYISVGNQAPPPNRYERQWQQPYPNAVWVPGHNEWRKERYVWVPGYYSYPPRGKKKWVGPNYRHAPNGYYYRPGYWAN